MYTIKFALLAMLGFVAMIGATPLEDRAPPYVPLLIITAP
jgi:hypothetical protein